ncbi:MAG: ABC transporter ATP-binding protein [Gemmatimonadaceae bacterium]
MTIPPASHLSSLAFPATAVRMSGIEKSFGAVRANRGASLEVREGEIHALVGENGAGKSTLMHILSGMAVADAGRVEVKGRNVTGWHTPAAIAAGVGMVHQHFMLVPRLTVAENVVLGREPTRAGMLDHAAAIREVQALSDRTGLRVPAARTVGDLTLGEAQRVEILKALYRGASTLILDEPTAVLSPIEVAELWRVLRTLRDAGSTIVLITHKLDEVVDISETITVMRAGQTVARLATAATTPRDIARAMVGRDVALSYESAGEARPTRAPRPSGLAAPPPALEVRDLVVPGPRRAASVNGVTFAVSAGEILGIAGVEGNGQTALVEALAGLRAITAGTVRLAGGGGVAARDITHLSVRDRSDAGLSHIPEDRQTRGLVMDYSVADNLILGRQHRFRGAIGLDVEGIADHARERIAAFDIRPVDPSLPARALSGGNQQKVVVAREMGRDFAVLLAAQPTRGVDVGAIEFIHTRLRRAREAGRAIVLVSADLSEVLALSDRVAVMYGGRIVATMERQGATAERIGRYMTGAASNAPDTTA